MYDNLPDIHGIDSFQALILAVGLLKNLLTVFVDGGGQLYWVHEKVKMEIDELFNFGIYPVAAADPPPLRGGSQLCLALNSS